MDKTQYVKILMAELFKHINSDVLDLTNPETLNHMGKIFTSLKTPSNKRVALNLISKLNEEQFSIMFSELKNNVAASFLAQFPFVTPHIKDPNDLKQVFTALGSSISKQKLISKYKNEFYRYKAKTVKSKLPYEIFDILNPLIKLKLLRIFSEIKEYPFIEKVDKNDLKTSLFPIMFTHTQGIQNFLDNWKW